jgi:hypothetical protein
MALNYSSELSRFNPRHQSFPVGNLLRFAQIPKAAIQLKAMLKLIHSGEALTAATIKKRATQEK